MSSARCIIVQYEGCAESPKLAKNNPEGRTGLATLAGPSTPRSAPASRQMVSLSSQVSLMRPRISAYDRGRMSPYRADHRGHSNASNGYSSDNGSVSSEDGPTYVLEHLATFRVSPESDLVYPADGMRRLLHMEKTSGIWTQKMTLRLDKKWVYIQSHENGDVVEKFPMELIREPTAFTSEDPKEMYNNIFIFVVAEDPKRIYQNPTEMHIFQDVYPSLRTLV
ncbi:Epidermal growth factor receptor kinase substrate 8 [Portunus trituberculatus]|uniref:Epidermal growth factor receptor kinase substrate 8 n=1 Tax=Portunus trituberculatus TaxID=210409 RepID=A0A5B7F092_PORTR|nr:Epidermal growth factor receptor kinase substrate 8 [Portunus trituberculatus]